MPLSRLLMSAAALVLGSIGIACLFAPDVVLTSLAGAAAPGAMLLVQVFGTLSFGVALLDWMWKGNRLGGIYGRPIVMANVAHFASAAVAMCKALSSEPALRTLWPVAVIYMVLGAAFFILLFRDPTAPAPAPSGL